MIATVHKPVFTPRQALSNGADTTPGDKVVVVGLGVTGLSCARHLAAAGTPFVVTDSRQSPPQLAQLHAQVPDAVVVLGGFDMALLDNASQLIVSPGVSLSEPFIAAARARGIAVLGDVELFARLATAPVAAVTGSNGKSTVTTMLDAMLVRAGLSVATGGNLGRPALDLLLDGPTDLYLLELSSFQLERTHSLTPAVAAVLNLSPDHMDRYTDLAGYAAAKARIFHSAGHAVFNRDDRVVADMAAGCQATTSFGQGQPEAGQYGLRLSDGETWLARGDELLLAASEIRIRGNHNLMNALAALAMARSLQAPQRACLDALREFRGLEHRMEWVGEAGGVTWINDSKGTNVGATVAAIAGLPETLVLIAGGQGKGANFEPLAHALRGKARGAVLIGQDAPRIERSLTGICPLVRANDMHEAVAVAARIAQAGDTVLLSPACASLDMFDNFEHRGDAFRAAVAEWLR